MSYYDVLKASLDAVVSRSVLVDADEYESLRRVASIAHRIHNLAAMGSPGYESIYTNPPEEFAELHNALMSILKGEQRG